MSFDLNILTVVANLILVAITGYYSWLTLQSVKQDKQPLIQVVRIEKSVEAVHRPNIFLKNIGFGPAVQVRVKIPGHRLPSGVSVARGNVGVILIGQEIEIKLTVNEDGAFFSRSPIWVEYRDGVGRKYWVRAHMSDDLQDHEYYSGTCGLLTQYYRWRTDIREIGHLLKRANGAA